MCVVGGARRHALSVPVVRLIGGAPLTEPEGPMSLTTGLTPRERRNPGDVAEARDRSGVFVDNCTEVPGNVKQRGGRRPRLAPRDHP